MFTADTPTPGPAAEVVRFRPGGQEDLAPSGVVSRLRANITALRTLRAIQADANRPATPEEQAVMARWSGWGAVPAVWDEGAAQYADLQWARDELAELLDASELAAARRTTLNAHYTDAGLVQAMWQALRDLGFDSGRVLEPGCGAGNFLAFAPDEAEVVGVELDPTTAAIAAAVHPQATVLAESFADTRIPDGTFDAAIGNVPFADVVLHDRRHNQGGHSIHNHFILKSLAATKPGGLVAVITSAWTMDAMSPAARREMATLGDLVGAVRLPNGAHRRAAGTDALTDVLLFRRREPDREPDGVAWERTRPVEIGGETIRVNEYFLDHPENVLGDLGVDHGRYQSAEVVVRGDRDAAAGLTAALDRIVAQARDKGLTFDSTPPEPAVRRAALVPTADREPDGYLQAHADGSFTQVVDGITEPYQPAKTQAAELRALLGLRDTVRALLEAEAASLDDTDDIDRLRAQLNQRYDAYVARYRPINRSDERRTGRVDPKTGEQVMARVRPRQGGFGDDPYAPLVYALEHFDEARQIATKADIFTQRVVSVRVPRLGADNPADALAICLDTYGVARLDKIADLLGMDEPEARHALGTLAFDEPDTGRLVSAPEYLSGNVRLKLEQARAAAAEDPDRYTVNVDALTKVIPRDLTPSEITAQLGASWIDKRYVQQFFREILEDPHLTVEHPYASVWAVKSDQRYSVLSTTRWGTERYPATDLAEALLQQRQIRVTDEDIDGKRILNPEASVAAQEKAAEMAERFSEWIWEDPARAAELTRGYNRQFNSSVMRSYDNVTLTLPGLTKIKTFKPRPHQIAAVARIIAEPSVGLFHEVGAGKTAVMVMAAMELRRLGFVKKPVIVVPNHMLTQFTTEFLQLYPQAKLLAASTADLTKDKRRRFQARCATGDWDAVIMTRSAFERIPMSRQVQQEYLEREVQQLREAVERAEESGERRSLKRLEGMLLRAEERVKNLLDSEKDPGLTFENTGIDYVFADEAHAYKNLRTPSNIPNLSVDGSKRASDLDMKLHWLRTRYDRVATLATATPIANSMGETYIMLKYLRPDLLADLGIDNFDTFASTFGKMVTGIEVAPEGGLRINTRFSKFVNVPELIRPWNIAADIKTAEDLKLPVPLLAQREDGQRLPETVIVPPSEELKEFIFELGERADKVRNGAVDAEIDNMLKITTQGKAAALALQLVGRSTSEPGKIEVAADNIASIYQETADRVYPGPDGEPHPTPGALQLVFADLGTPHPDRWNVYDTLRDELAARGVPREKIRFIHEARNDKEKGELFAACRDGRVAVLIGSTEKMGVGTNVQKRAVALHHLDCPWRPADLQQREGRIIRQGNANPEIRVIRYITEGSFDGYSWETVARKAQFIAQIMRGRLDIREIEDIGDAALSYNEVKALATGNPLLLKLAQAQAEATRLERLERAHGRSQDSLGWTIRDANSRIEDLTQRIAQIDAAIARRVDVSGDKFTMNVDGRQYAKRSEANQHLQTFLAARLNNPHTTPNVPFKVGTYAGFTVTAEVFQDVFGGRKIFLQLADVPGASMRLDRSEVTGGDLVTRLGNRIAGLEKLRAEDMSTIESCREEITRAEQQLGQPFRHAEALAGAQARLTDITAQLEEIATPTQPPPQSPPQPPSLDAAAPAAPHADVDDDGWLAAAVAHDAAAMAAHFPGQVTVHNDPASFLAAIREAEARSAAEMMDEAQPDRAVAEAPGADLGEDERIAAVAEAQPAGEVDRGQKSWLADLATPYIEIRQRVQDLVQRHHEAWWYGTPQQRWETQEELLQALSDEEDFLNLVPVTEVGEGQCILLVEGQDPGPRIVSGVVTEDPYQPDPTLPNYAVRLRSTLTGEQVELRRANYISVLRLAEPPRRDGRPQWVDEYTPGPFVQAAYERMGELLQRAYESAWYGDPEQNLPVLREAGEFLGRNSAAFMVPVDTIQTGDFVRAEGLHPDTGEPESVTGIVVERLRESWETHGESQSGYHLQLMIPKYAGGAGGGTVHEVRVPDGSYVIRTPAPVDRGRPAWLDQPVPTQQSEAEGQGEPPAPDAADQPADIHPEVDETAPEPAQLNEPTAEPQETIDHTDGDAARESTPADTAPRDDISAWFDRLDPTFRDRDLASLGQELARVAADPRVQQSARANALDNFQIAFTPILDDHFVNVLNTSPGHPPMFIDAYFRDEAFRERLIAAASVAVYETARASTPPPTRDDPDTRTAETGLPTPTPATAGVADQTAVDSPAAASTVDDGVSTEPRDPQTGHTPAATEPPAVPSPDTPTPAAADDDLVPVVTDWYRSLDPAIRDRWDEDRDLAWLGRELADFAANPRVQLYVRVTPPDKFESAFAPDLRKRFASMFYSSQRPAFLDAWFDDDEFKKSLVAFASTAVYERVRASTPPPPEVDAAQVTTQAAATARLIRAVFPNAKKIAFTLSEDGTTTLTGVLNPQGEYLWPFQDQRHVLDSDAVERLLEQAYLVPDVARHLGQALYIVDLDRVLEGAPSAADPVSVTAVATPAQRLGDVVPAAVDDPEPDPGFDRNQVDQSIAPDIPQGQQSPDPGPLRVEVNGNSVLVKGTSKEDLAIREILGKPGFRWSKDLDAWWLPRNLRATTRQRKINRFLDGMEQAGRERPPVIDISTAAAEIPAAETTTTPQLATASPDTDEPPKLPRSMTWGPEHFAVGDLVRVGRSWYQVEWVNQKSLRVPGSARDRISWDRVSGWRRGPWQRYSPNEDPWPVHLTDRVTSWRGYLNDIKKFARPAQRVHQDRAFMAMRLVLGVPLDTPYNDFRALVTQGGTAQIRAREAEFADVLDRLLAGETPEDIRRTGQLSPGAAVAVDPPGRKQPPAADPQTSENPELDGGHTTDIEARPQTSSPTTTAGSDTGADAAEPAPALFEMSPPGTPGPVASSPEAPGQTRGAVVADDAAPTRGVVSGDRRPMVERFEGSVRHAIDTWVRSLPAEEALGRAVADADIQTWLTQMITREAGRPEVTRALAISSDDTSPSAEFTNLVRDRLAGSRRWVRARRSGQHNPFTDLYMNDPAAADIVDGFITRSAHDLARAVNLAETLESQSLDFADPKQFLTAVNTVHRTHPDPDRSRLTSEQAWEQARRLTQRAFDATRHRKGLQAQAATLELANLIGSNLHHFQIDAHLLRPGDFAVVEGSHAGSRVRHVVTGKVTDLPETTEDDLPGHLEWVELRPEPGTQPQDLRLTTGSRAIRLPEPSYQNKPDWLDQGDPAPPEVTRWAEDAVPLDQLEAYLLTAAIEQSTSTIDTDPVVDRDPVRAGELQQPDRVQAAGPVASETDVSGGDTVVAPPVRPDTRDAAAKRPAAQAEEDDARSPAGASPQTPPPDDLPAASDPAADPGTPAGTGDLEPRGAGDAPEPEAPGTPADRETERNVGQPPGGWGSLEPFQGSLLAMAQERASAARARLAARGVSEQIPDLSHRGERHPHAPSVQVVVRRAVDRWADRQRSWIIRYALDDPNREWLTGMIQAVSEHPAVVDLAARGNGQPFAELRVLVGDLLAASWQPGTSDRLDRLFGIHLADPARWDNLSGFVGDAAYHLTQAFDLVEALDADRLTVADSTRFLAAVQVAGRSLPETDLDFSEINRRTAVLMQRASEAAEHGTARQAQTATLELLHLVAGAAPGFEVDLEDIGTRDFLLVEGTPPESHHVRTAMGTVREAAPVSRDGEWGVQVLLDPIPGGGPPQDLFVTLDDLVLRLPAPQPARERPAWLDESDPAAVEPHVPLFPADATLAELAGRLVISYLPAHTPEADQRVDASGPPSGETVSDLLPEQPDAGDPPVRDLADVADSGGAGPAVDPSLPDPEDEPTDPGRGPADVAEGSAPDAADDTAPPPAAAHTVAVDVDGVTYQVPARFNAEVLRVRTGVDRWPGRVAALAPMTVTGSGYNRSVANNLATAVLMARHGDRDDEAEHWLDQAERAAGITTPATEPEQPEPAQPVNTVEAADPPTATDALNSEAQLASLANWLAGETPGEETSSGNNPPGTGDGPADPEQQDPAGQVPATPESATVAAAGTGGDPARPVAPGDVAPAVWAARMVRAAIPDAASFTFDLTERGPVLREVHTSDGHVRWTTTPRIGRSPGPRLDRDQVHAYLDRAYLDGDLVETVGYHRYAVDIDRAVAAPVPGPGEWGPGNVQVGDRVYVVSTHRDPQRAERGQWWEVTRVNRKSVTVENDRGAKATVRWGRVRGLRRHGEHYDTPASQPLPADVVDRADQWRQFRGRRSGDGGRDTREWRAQLRQTQRLVFGVPDDASDAEVAAYPDLPDPATRLELLARHTDVVTRLTVLGEPVERIRASLPAYPVQPAWRFPVDVEPVTRDAKGLELGDLVRGVWTPGRDGLVLDTYVGGHVTDLKHLDVNGRTRPKFARWVEVTTAEDGATHTLPGRARLAVYPAATLDRDTPAAAEEPAQPDRQAAADDVAATPVEVPGDRAATTPPAQPPVDTVHTEHATPGLPWEPDRADTVDAALQVALAVADRHGWVSRDDAVASRGARVSTAELVRNALHGTGEAVDRFRGGLRDAITPDLVERAAAARAWGIRQATERSGRYYRDLAAALGRDTVGDHLALVVSTVSGYTREQQQERERRIAANSQWQGSRRKRLGDLNVTVLSTSDSQFRRGSETRVRVVDGDGNVYVWSTIKPVSDLTEGSELELRGTVAEHIQSGGVKETELFRVDYHVTRQAPPPHPPIGPPGLDVDPDTRALKVGAELVDPTGDSPEIAALAVAARRPGAGAPSEDLRRDMADRMQALYTALWTGQGRAPDYVATTIAVGDLLIEHGHRFMARARQLRVGDFVRVPIADAKRGEPAVAVGWVRTRTQRAGALVLDLDLPIRPAIDGWPPPLRVTPETLVLRVPGPVSGPGRPAWLDEPARQPEHDNPQRQTQDVTTPGTAPPRPETEAGRVDVDPVSPGLRSAPEPQIADRPADSGTAGRETTDPDRARLDQMAGAANPDAAPPPTSRHGEDPAAETASVDAANTPADIPRQRAPETTGNAEEGERLALAAFAAFKAGRLGVARRLIDEAEQVAPARSAGRDSWDAVRKRITAREARVAAGGELPGGDLVDLAWIRVAVGAHAHAHAAPGRPVVDVARAVAREPLLRRVVGEYGAVVVTGVAAAQIEADPAVLTRPDPEVRRREAHRLGRLAATAGKRRDFPAALRWLTAASEICPTLMQERGTTWSEVIGPIAALAARDNPGGGDRTARPGNTVAGRGPARPAKRPQQRRDLER